MALVFAYSLDPAFGSYSAIKNCITNLLLRFIACYLLLSLVGSEDEAEREAAAFAKPHTHTAAVSSRALFTLLHFSSCNTGVTYSSVSIL
jgi:hypothetical protein